MEVLFKTIHGSHLYGLATAESDVDYFTVVSKKPGTTAHTRKRYAKQKITDGIDSTVVDLGTFLVGCDKGVPQYLEAMFSTAAEIDKIGALRAGYRVGNQALDTYRRTIKSFAMSDTFKTKRHALRLAINMAEFGRYGRFNPTLLTKDITYISAMAERPSEWVYALALSMSW